MASITWVLSVLVLISFIAFSQGSHFRYGSMTVTKNPSNPKQLTYTYVMGAKRSYYGAPNVGSVLSNAVSFYMNGAAISGMSPVVTNIDIANDILYATTTYTYTASGPGTYNGYAYSSARISNLNNNANQAFQMGATAVLTAAEISSGIVNNSPTTNSLPVITIPYQVVPYTYQIPASDPEGNPLVFSMASSAQMGGSGNTNPSGLSVSSSGLVTISSALAKGFWSTQQIITDSAGNYACVDYLLNVAAATAYCSNNGASCSINSQCGSGQCVNPSPYIFVDDINSGASKRTNLPAPANGATLSVAAGSTLTVNIVADDSNLNSAPNAVVISWAALPTRASTSTQSACDSAHSCTCVGCNTQPQLSTLTYSPIASDAGSKVICLSVTSLGTPLPYTQHCFTVVVTAVTSVCGNGILESGEVCDGGSCCTSSCTFASSSTVCRSSNGDCDVAETCTGSSASCPADSFASSAVTCRSSNGPCDVAEQCTGSSASCPADSFASSSSVCRASNGVCDVAEQCTGSSASCPADSFASSAVTCRSSNGPCDIAEQCSGSSASCPADSFQSAATICRAAAGVCDVAEQCTGSSASCPADSFASSSTVCRDSIGPCDAVEKCSGSAVTCPADVTGSFETDCIGLTFVAPGQTTSFLNYDVISFNNLVGTTGNIEGRVAVKNNITVGDGWSVGSSIGHTATDLSIKYSLVAGRNVRWNSGNLFPDQVHYPSGAPTENAFVGDVFTGSNAFVEYGRIEGNCSNSGCLDQEFNDVQACYGAYQNVLSSGTDNVQKLIQWSGLYLTCDSATDLIYRVTIHPSEMSQYTWVSLSNCNPNARYIVNIDTTSNVALNGVTLTTTGHVIYNIQGSGRTVSIGWIQVVGDIIAPYNTIYQTGGSIIGKVVAGDITASLNINRGNNGGCFIPSA